MPVVDGFAYTALTLSIINSDMFHTTSLFPNISSLIEKIRHFWAFMNFHILFQRDIHPCICMFGLTYLVFHNCSQRLILHYSYVII